MTQPPSDAAMRAAQEIVDKWIEKFDGHFHARDAQRRAELVNAIAELLTRRDTLLNNARCALADIAGSKDLRTVGALRDRARVAYQEIVKALKVNNDK